MKQDIENIIKKNLPEPAKGIEKVIENTEQDRIYNLLNENMVIGFNQALSQIDTKLIADEVLKVVVEKITKDILDEIEQYIVSAKAIKINKQQADFVYWYDIKLAIKRLLSNLSTNKENKNNG